VTAYANLRRHLGLRLEKIGVSGLNAQAARLDEDFLDRLRVDTRFVPPARPGQQNEEENDPGMRPNLREEAGYWSYTDE
jgi:hypothetical protein